MRELAQLGQRLLRVAAQLFEHRADRRRVGVEQLAGEPELHRERDEVLLRAVVQVALDLAARLVGRGDDARTRGAQLLVRDTQVVERRLQRGVERASCAARARPGVRAR